MMIETKGLRRAYTTRRGRHKTVVEAVRGVDLSVDDGEIFGFLGPNGAGKTTTVRMLATLLRPDDGTATVAGHDLMAEPRAVRRRLGYVSQAGGVDEGSTVRDNLVHQGRLCRLDARTAAERSIKLLDALDLAPLGDRMARTLSGGQRRRLALALGLVHSPAVLFLDEPTLGLDPHGRARLWEEIRRLRTDGTTVLLTTHYLDEADALCDRIAIIDHGVVAAEGTPRELKSGIAGDAVVLSFGDSAGDADRARAALEPLVREARQDGEGLRVYVGDGERALPRILRALAEADVDVESIALTRPSLDDVFLRRTGRSLREGPA